MPSDFALPTVISRAGASPRRHSPSYQGQVEDLERRGCHHAGPNGQPMAAMQPKRPCDHDDDDDDDDDGNKFQMHMCKFTSKGKSLPMASLDDSQSSKDPKGR